MTPRMVCWVGDSVNKSALPSSSQTGLMTHRSQNGCSTNVKLKRGDANTGKGVETFHPDGSTLKRLLRLPATQIPKAACVSTFSQTSICSLVLDSVSNPYIQLKLARPDLSCTQLKNATWQKEGFWARAWITWQGCYWDGSSSWSCPYIQNFYFPKPGLLSRIRKKRQCKRQSVPAKI